MSTSLTVHPFRHIPHQPCWDLQEHYRTQIIEGNAKNQLLLVEHPRTITLGRAEKGQNLSHQQAWYSAQGFDVVNANRGGHVTYHGPGQLVAYPIVDLQELGLGVKSYVHCLEQAMILTLDHFGIKSSRSQGQPGVYIDGYKIGSVGIHLRRFVSIHGIALNVNTDLHDFSTIVPCGIQNIQMTSMKQLGIDTSVENVALICTKHLVQQLGVDKVMHAEVAAK